MTLMGPRVFMQVTPELIRELGGQGNDALILVWIDFRINTEHNTQAYQDMDGRDWWRAPVAVVSAETGFSVSQVRTSLNRLVEKGYLQAEEHGLDGIRDKAKSYALNGPVVRETPGHSHLSDLTNAFARSDKSYYLSKEVKTKAKDDLAPVELETEDRFEEWYAIYPRHEGVAQARKKFTAALKLTKGDAEPLIHGAKLYATEKAGEQKKFIKLPATWLFQECWRDYEQQATGISEIQIESLISNYQVQELEDLTKIYYLPEFDPTLDDLPPEQRQQRKRDAWQQWARQNVARMLATSSPA